MGNPQEFDCDVYPPIGHHALDLPIGLFQKKSTPPTPRQMGFWKFLQEGGEEGGKTLEIQAGGGVELEKVFYRGHFDR